MPPTQQTCHYHVTLSRSDIKTPAFCYIIYITCRYLPTQRIILAHHYTKHCTSSTALFSDSMCTNSILFKKLHFNAPSALWVSKDRHKPFPGQMAHKAMKPGCGYYVYHCVEVLYTTHHHHHHHHHHRRFVVRHLRENQNSSALHHHLTIQKD